MTVTTILALTTLYGMTQIGSFLFYVMQPKVAKASKEGAIWQALSRVYIGEVYAIMPATATLTTYLPWPHCAAQQR